MIELLKSYGGLSYVSLLFIEWSFSVLFGFVCSNSLFEFAGPKWKPFRTETGATPSAQQVWLGNWTVWARLLQLSYHREGLNFFSIDEFYTLFKDIVRFKYLIRFVKQCYINLHTWFLTCVVFILRWSIVMINSLYL